MFPHLPYSGHPSCLAIYEDLNLAPSQIPKSGRGPRHFETSLIWRSKPEPAVQTSSRCPAASNRPSLSFFEGVPSTAQPIWQSRCQKQASSFMFGLGGVPSQKQPAPQTTHAKMEITRTSWPFLRVPGWSRHPKNPAHAPPRCPRTSTAVLGSG